MCFLLFALCVPCRDSGGCLVLVLSLLHWLSTGVPGCFAMVSKLRRRVRGSRGKSMQTESWRVRSRLMGERSGCANSDQSQVCGRGGVAGAAAMTSQQVCVGSTGRRSPQGLENGLQALFDVKRRGRHKVQKFGGRSRK